MTEVLQVLHNIKEITMNLCTASIVSFWESHNRKYIQINESVMEIHQNNDGLYFNYNTATCHQIKAA